MNQPEGRARRDPRMEKLRAAAAFYRGVALFLVVVVCVQAAVIIWQSQRSRIARAIRVDDEVACFVRNEKAADLVLQELLNRHKGDLPGAAFLEQKWEDLNWPMDREDKVLSVPEAVELLEGQVTIKVAAAAITVGDKELVVLPTQEEAQDALDKLKKDHSTGPGKLVEARFDPDNVRIADTRAHPGSILTGINEAAVLLKQPYQALGTYRVKPGDSWRKMARVHGVTFEELRRINPEFSDVAPTGKDIKVPTKSASLTVVTVMEETREAPVKAEPQLIPTEAMAEGERRKTRDGQDGKKRVTERVTYRNGEEAGREQVSEVVTAEPIPERIMVGTARTAPE